MINICMGQNIITCGMCACACTGFGASQSSEFSEDNNTTVAGLPVNVTIGSLLYYIQLLSHDTDSCSLVYWSHY